MFPVVMNRFANAVANGEEKVAQILAEAQHFVISEEIVEFISKIIADEIKSYESGVIDCDWIVPIDARLMANTVTICKNESSEIFCILARNNDQIWMFLSSSTTTKFLGWFKPGTSKIRLEVDRKHKDYSWWLRDIIECSLMLSLINEPRYVRQCDVSTRPERRRIKKMTGVTVQGWHRVTWNIAGSISARRGQAAVRHGVALHFRRAHWRRAHEGAPKSERRDYCPGWWCWVRESWAGHPAFGVRLHHYTPKLTGDAAAKMPIGAAGVAALRAAGHVSDDARAPA